LACYGVDVDPTGVHDAFGFAAADGCTLPYADGSFGACMSLGLVEHFPARVRSALIAEQMRVVAPDGVVICLMPNLNPSFR